MKKNNSLPLDKNQFDFRLIKEKEYPLAIPYEYARSCDWLIKMVNAWHDSTLGEVLKRFGLGDDFFSYIENEQSQALALSHQSKKIRELVGKISQVESFRSDEDLLNILSVLM